MTFYRCQFDFWIYCKRVQDKCTTKVGDFSDCPLRETWSEQSKKYLSGKAVKGRKPAVLPPGGRTFIVSKWKGQKRYRV